MEKQVLIVDDDKLSRETLARSLAGEYQCRTAANGREALEIITTGEIDIVLADLMMPEMGGLKMLEETGKMREPPVVIMITGHGTVESAVAAMKLGAYDYVTKPVNLERLALLLQKALETWQLRRENILLRNKLRENYAPTRMIGKSPAMAKILEQLERVAATATTVLIEGESGTGKELIANHLHFNSPRAAGPFIKINCAAFVDNLLESELFGHERGAFTGAVAAKKGRFELADGGTLFLDEIGDLPATAQARLLRFLQEKTFERVGGVKTFKVDIRLVSATNRNLEEMVARGEFREDLFYRLCVVRLKTPPLRERKEDLPALIDHFLAHYSETHNRPISGLDRAARDFLLNHPWPGNVRELMNCLECMVVSAARPRLGLPDIPEHLRRLPPPYPDPGGVEADGLLAQNEKQLIAAALRQTGMNKVAAAKLLGIGLRTLYRKIDKWNL
jgi:two-component system, NtrC family, response regulator AtoC